MARGTAYARIETTGTAPKKTNSAVAGTVVLGRSAASPVAAVSTPIVPAAVAARSIRPGLASKVLATAAPRRCRDIHRMSSSRPTAAAPTATVVPSAATANPPKIKTHPITPNPLRRQARRPVAPAARSRRDGYGAGSPVPPPLESLPTGTHLRNSAPYPARRTRVHQPC